MCGDYRMLDWTSAVTPPFDMTLTLIVPGLCARGAAALAATPALRAFARYARAPIPTREGLDAAMFSALGLAAHSPPAPLAAFGAGADVGDDYVLAATPVTLIAGRDDVMLAGRVSDLDPRDSAATIELMNRHFAEDGLSFFAPRPSSWYARMARSPELTTTPLDVALGQPILPHLPGGAEGRTWQRWQNEIEMLLHEHAVNQTRETTGLPPITGLWFWGGGRLADVTPAGALGAVAVVATAGEIGDVVRGLARRAGQTADDLPHDFSAMLARMRGGSHGAIVLPDMSTDDMLEPFGTAWLAPAVDALERGRIDVLQLVANGHGAAATWRAPRPAAFARFAAHFRQPRFDVPASPAA
jgi:hypothetical protein